jgi:hypothetical protein
MLATGQELRKTSKLYRAESTEFNDGRIAALTAKTGAELAVAATSRRISLDEVDEVKARTLAYLKACEEAAVIPSMSGLARSLGMTRRALESCVERQSPAPTAEWLLLVKDAFSDVLAESALRKNCDSITGIFLLKSLFGLRESVEIVAGQQDSRFGEQKTAEQIAEEYAALPESE